MDANPIHWYRSPISRDELRRFTEKSDLKGWLQAGSFLLIFLCTTAGAIVLFERKLWIPMVVVCYLHSAFLQMVGMSAAVHELSHGTVFKRKGPNEFFYHLFCFLTWNSPVHFRNSHMLHHQLTVYRGRDKEVIQGPVKDKMNLGNYLSWLTFDYQWFWTLVSINVRHALGDGDADFFSWDPLFQRDDPRRKQMIRWARFAVLSYIVLTVGFALLHLWVLIYLIVFGNFFVSILGRLTGAIQHTGLAENTPDWRAVCHTVLVNPVVGYLYWHMNYHTEHHMYAAVPCFNLAGFSRTLAPDMPIPTRTFSAGLRRVLEIKRAQKTNPAYIFEPEMPATAAPIRRE